ncbi:MAG: cbb3-type cytochrome oxidase subunit 3 [Gammaproteobacteria bacterium]|jgi:cbb3-type cytochrome oxidase subunit 3
MSLLFSMWTVLVAIVFLGIVVWVFLGNKEEFDAAAQIPLEETDEPLIEEDSRGKSHG